MTLNLYNLLILLGALHGIMLAALLLVSTRNRRVSNLLLALILLFYTLPVLKTMLIDIGFFRAYDLWFFSVELLYGLGPSLFLYAKIVTNPRYAMSRLDYLHFIPVLLELVYYLSPLGPEKRYRLASPIEDTTHLLWLLQQAGAVVSVVVYLVLANLLLYRYSGWLKSNYSDIDKRTLSWLRYPVFLYSTFFALWLGLRFIDIIWTDDQMAIGPYYPLLIFLSLSTYWIGTKGYLESQLDVVGFDARKSLEAAAPVIDDPALSPVYQELVKVMERDQVYLENDLTLAALADRVQVKPRLLSKVINTQAGQNFYDFISQYRVEEFKRRVLQSDSPKTLLDLALECGFNSKATFNHVFKKHTGLTPSEYRSRAKNLGPTEVIATGDSK